MPMRRPAKRCLGRTPAAVGLLVLGALVGGVEIWAAPEGTTAQIPSPVLYPFLNLHVVVVRSGEGERGKWITETRNVAEDYRKLFGADPDKFRVL